MIEFLIRVLVAFVLGLFGISSVVTTEVEPQTEAMIRQATVIESVEVLVLESFPMQIDLHVTGYQAHGCDAAVQVAQSRDGQQVRVEIYTELPMGVMCPAVLRAYDDTIRLDGSFEPGTYQIDVNGTIVEVEL